MLILDRKIKIFLKIEKLKKVSEKNIKIKKF